MVTRFAGESYRVVPSGARPIRTDLRQASGKSRGNPLDRGVLCPATVARPKGPPMGIVRPVAEALQRALGEPPDRLGRDRGAIRRRREFSGSTSVQALVLTLLRRPRSRPEDYAAAMPGVEVTPRAVVKRFAPALVESPRAAPGRPLGEVVAAAPAAIPTLAKFAGVYPGDSITIPPPDAYAGQLPARGGSTGRSCPVPPGTWPPAAGPRWSPTSRPSRPPGRRRWCRAGRGGRSSRPSSSGSRTTRRPGRPRRSGRWPRCGPSRSRWWRGTGCRRRPPGPTRGGACSRRRG